MEEDYLGHYSLLCGETHHNADVLRFYMRDRRDGIEVHQQMHEFALNMYADLCFNYWVMAASELLCETGDREAKKWGEKLKKVVDNLRPAGNPVSPQ